MANANSDRTDGDLDDLKPGWLARQHKARRERVRNECVQVWRHESLHKHKQRRAERAGVPIYSGASLERALKESVVND